MDQTQPEFLKKSKKENIREGRQYVWWSGTAWHLKRILKVMSCCHMSTAEVITAQPLTNPEVTRRPFLYSLSFQQLSLEGAIAACSARWQAAQKDQEWTSLEWPPVSEGGNWWISASTPLLLEETILRSELQFLRRFQVDRAAASHSK